MIDSAKLEALKVWYALFTTLMDGHADGDYSDQQLIDKLKTLRAELKLRVPEAEPSKPH